MADPDNQTTSLRQLPAGKMSDILKMFENKDGETAPERESASKGNIVQSSPFKQRPIISVAGSPDLSVQNEDPGGKSRPRSDVPTGPTVAKMMTRLQNAIEGSQGEAPPREASPQRVPPDRPAVPPERPALPPEKPAPPPEKPALPPERPALPLERPVLKKTSFGGVDPKPKPPIVRRQKSLTNDNVEKDDETSATPDRQMNVVQRRTQMFEGTPVSSASPSVLNKPTPPIKPRSRPPSGNLDEEQKSPKHKASANAYCEAWDTKNKGKFEIIEIPSQGRSGNSSYCEAWDLKQNKIGIILSKPSTDPSPAKVPPTQSPAKAPPRKPPRTGAHDEYMRVKLKSETESSEPVSNKASDDSNEQESESTPTYRRINKQRPLSSEFMNGTLKSKKPDRPPPPRPRPVTVIGDNLASDEAVKFEHDKQKPVVPVSPKRFYVYEDISTGIDLDKIKHWDLDNQPRPQKGLRRSLSAECIHSEGGMGVPIYVDPDSLAGFRDDTDCDIYVDNSGYAVPYRPHQRLRGITKSLDQDAGICRPLSDAVIKQLKKLKPALKQKRSSESARNNWKKLQNQEEKVKMKINMAFAVLRQMKPEQKSQEDQPIEKVPGEEDSLLDLKEIERRISHCGLVRKNTSKSIRKSRMIQTQIYPQLFEFCLIVGLQPKEDQIGFTPKIIYKFPAHIESNVSIPEFCFPDAEEFDVKTASPAAPSESYSFVLTNVDGERVYGYCRRLVPFTTKDGLPEVLCIISPVDAFSMYNELLDEVETCRHKSLDLARELLSAAFGRPLPNPGDMVHVRTLDENWDMGTILLSRPSDFRVDNANREYLLSKLGVDKLLKLFSCILLERSVLFCAKSLSMLSQTIHALVSLLYPFRWQHTYIPVLPESMLDVCCSPTPYIIGILSSQLPYVQTLPIGEIVIFDLNKKQMIKSQGDEGTILPKDIQKALKTALNMCKVDADARSAQNLMISETFLRMFVESVGHFSDHITTQQDGQKVLVKEAFIQSAPTESIQQFLQWFTETQMFEVFVTEQTEKQVPKRKNSRNLELFNQRIIELKEESQPELKKNKNRNILMKLLKT